MADDAKRLALMEECLTALKRQLGTGHWHGCAMLVAGPSYVLPCNCGQAALATLEAELAAARAERDALAAVVEAAFAWRDTDKAMNACATLMLMEAIDVYRA